jgi:hypothetical protein
VHAPATTKNALAHILVIFIPHTPCRRAVEIFLCLHDPEISDESIQANNTGDVFHP